MGIGSLSASTPTSGQPGSTGQTELVSIKRELQLSFPQFTPGFDVCTLNGQQLSSAALKAANQTISGAWDFTTAPTLNGGSFASAAGSYGGLVIASSGAISFATTPAVVTNWSQSVTAAGMAVNVTSGIITLAPGTYRIGFNTNIVRSTGSASFFLSIYQNESQLLGTSRVTDPGTETILLMAERLITLPSSVPSTNFTLRRNGSNEDAILTHCNFFAEKVG